MVKSLLLFLTFGLAVNASVFYTFDGNYPSVGPVAFEYVSSNFLTAETRVLPSFNFDYCTVAGISCNGAQTINFFPDFGYNGPHGEDIDLIDVEGLDWGFLAGSLSELGSHDGSYLAYYSGSTGTLTVTSNTPEPGYLALMGLSLGLGCSWLSRRKRTRPKQSTS